MIINATAELYYNEGLSIASGMEGLYLIVKFKQKGKIFNIKLKEVLACNSKQYNQFILLKEKAYNSMDEYYDDVEAIVNDKEYIERCAIEMIQKYFDKMKKDNKEYDRKSTIVKKTKELPKIEIKVEIK